MLVIHDVSTLCTNARRVTVMLGNDRESGVVATVDVDEKAGKLLRAWLDAERLAEEQASTVALRSRRRSCRK